ncbi:molecular chaperone DnaJ [Candidatus Palauibacter sp.]|uniref:molecular chaperone DnaJ n=1 Tax=Candidatus Palauibacter sp. TaxID=3101350 RepID=UPI003B58D76C
MATQAKDYYKILGVAENAGADDIRKAYRSLAKKHHPDANAGDPASTEKFKEVSEAHGVLSDPDKRKKYDRVRKYGGLGAFSPGPAGGAPGGGGGFKFEDLSDLGGIGGIFSSIFDFGKKTRTETEGPQRGRNVEYLVTIPLRTAARGGRVSVTVPISEECATCDGNGAAPGTSLQRCPECEGKGEVTFGQGGFSVSRPCPVCVGRGAVPETPCSSCSGRGQVNTRRKLSVKVPEGVETGSRVRLSGQGERGPGGGPAGDLIIKCRVEPDRFFTRDGLDLACEVPINVAQAILGSKVKVRTIDGNKVVLRIPPGTQSGTAFRIRGQGLRRGDNRGDQLVKVIVETPDLSGEGLKAVQDLAKQEGLPH